MSEMIIIIYHYQVMDNRIIRIISIIIIMINTI